LRSWKGSSPVGWLAGQFVVARRRIVAVLFGASSENTASRPRTHEINAPSSSWRTRRNASSRGSSRPSRSSSPATRTQVWPGVEVFAAQAVAATLEGEDLGVVDQSIDHRGGGHVVAEDLRDRRSPPRAGGPSASAAWAKVAGTSVSTEMGIREANASASAPARRGVSTRRSANCENGATASNAVEVRDTQWAKAPGGAAPSPK
jgi:hypothetical protein